MCREYLYNYTSKYIQEDIPHKKTFIYIPTGASVCVCVCIEEGGK